MIISLNSHKERLCSVMTCSIIFFPSSYSLWRYTVYRELRNNRSAVYLESRISQHIHKRIKQLIHRTVRLSISSGTWDSRRRGKSVFFKHRTHKRIEVLTPYSFISKNILVCLYVIVKSIYIAHFAKLHHVLLVIGVCDIVQTY